MARFQSTVDVWDLTPKQRARLMPGQWVKAGPAGPKGRYWGQTRGGSDVVAWSQNAKASRMGWRYHRTLRDYALGTA